MYKEEVALRFSYSYERIDEAKELERLLDSKNIKFIFYESMDIGNMNLWLDDLGVIHGMK